MINQKVRCNKFFKWFNW